MQHALIFFMSIRLDFLAGYNQLKKLVTEPSTDSTNSGALKGDFSKLLDVILPKEKTINSDNWSSAALPDDFADEEHLMARFSTGAAQLEAPNIDLLPPPETLQSGVKLPALLAPEIVSAKRIAQYATSQALSDEQTQPIVKIQRELERAGARKGVDPLLGLAVVSAESSFNPNAVSKDGHESKGLFQLLDETGQSYHQELGLNSEYDPFNVQQNIEIGVSYLRKLHDHFSSTTELGRGLATTPAANSASLEKLAVAAFNAGEGRVASAQKQAANAGKDPSDYASIASYLPDSTQEYVEKVLLAKQQLSSRFIG